MINIIDIQKSTTKYRNIMGDGDIRISLYILLKFINL